MDIMNFIDIVRLVSTNFHYNIAQVIIKPHLTILCRCGLLLQNEKRGVSVCLSIGLSQSWSYKNSWTDRDAIWSVDSGGHKESHNNNNTVFI